MPQNKSLNMSENKVNAESYIPINGLFEMIVWPKTYNISAPILSDLPNNEI